jgi:hypothetical protein
MEAAEFRAFESIGSPVGVRIYLTFLVDQQGTDVWALDDVPERPQERFAVARLFCLPGLGYRWQKEMPALFYGLLNESINYFSFCHDLSSITLPLFRSTISSNSHTSLLILT